MLAQTKSELLNMRIAQEDAADAAWQPGGGAGGAAAAPKESAAAKAKALGASLFKKKYESSASLDPRGGK